VFISTDIASNNEAVYISAADYAISEKTRALELMIILE